MLGQPTVDVIICLISIYVELNFNLRMCTSTQHCHGNEKRAKHLIRNEDNAEKNGEFCQKIKSKRVTQHSGNRMNEMEERKHNFCRKKSVLMKTLQCKSNPIIAEPILINLSFCTIWIPRCENGWINEENFVWIVKAL